MSSMIGYALVGIKSAYKLKISKGLMENLGKKCKLHAELICFRYFAALINVNNPESYV